MTKADPHAPRYHFIPPEGVCLSFDPNGALFWKGRYHLFYLFQDAALKSGPEFWQSGHCWGHASSADLVHWTYHPTALAPSPAGPEAAIYSGCALISKEGVPTLVYHGYGAGTCIATAGDDELISWHKSPHNPVIPQPGEGQPGWGVYNVFDPHVWLEGDTYYAVLGGQVKPMDRRDTAYLFRSPDLIHWEYLRPFYAPNPAWTTEGDDCACPDFFSLGGKHVLLCISHATGARAYVGRWGRDVFVPESHQLMNWPGGACFAPETLVDDTGRRIMWAWAMDQRLDWWKHGALGVMTLPRVLTLDAAGVLTVAPPKELESLRGRQWRRESITLAGSQTVPLGGASGDCLEIELETVGSPSGRLGLRLGVSPDGVEHTDVIYDAGRGEIVIDVSSSSRAGDGWRPFPMDFWRGFTPANLTAQRTPFRLADGEPLRLRVFLDRSILEVFVNGKICLTQRLYPRDPQGAGLSLWAQERDVTIRHINVWVMKAANGE